MSRKFIFFLMIYGFDLFIFSHIRGIKMLP